MSPLRSDARIYKGVFKPIERFLMAGSRTDQSLCDARVARSGEYVLRLLLVRDQEARGVNRALRLLQARQHDPGGRRTSSSERRRMLPRELAALMPSSCGLRTGSQSVQIVYHGTGR
jgi:hypothetical protein